MNRGSYDALAEAYEAEYRSAKQVPNVELTGRAAQAGE